MTTVADLIAYLEDFAPLRLAAEWDNVGLLLGDRAAPIERVMTCLTVTPETAREAMEAGAQLIVTHHPILFRPTKRLTADNPEGRMLLSLARAAIAVYSPHTAFDNCAGGINDLLAQRLALQEVQPLRLGEGPRQCKVVVFVPDNDLARVADAMFAAGAGQIGQYSECSFRLPGTGTFRGSAASNPTVGQKGRREEVSEWRLEAVCPEEAVSAVVTALRCAHSYEEPAYDVYPLRPGKALVGMGRIGLLSPARPAAELASLVRDCLEAGSVQVVGDPGRLVERVAVACGAGGEFLADAAQSMADVFLTGEMRFHDYLSARSMGVVLLLPGHYATERPGIEALAKRLQSSWPLLQVWASRNERDPVRDDI